MASVTAFLLLRLEAILAEITAMQIAIDDAVGVAPESRRALKAGIEALRAEADRLSAWLSEARLEQAIN